MRIDRIDLNLFRAFLAIYDNRNLTRAAESLNISQPAVSNILARLRELLQDPVFERRPAGMVPTALAEQIVDDVRQGVALLQASAVGRPAFEPAVARRDVCISMNDLGELLLMPELLARAARVAPRIRWQTVYLNRTDLQRELAAGTLDLALDAPLLEDPQLGHEPLLQDHYVCLLRHGHPASAGELTLERYLALDHIHISSRRRGTGIVDAALQRLGIGRRIVMRSPHYLAAPLHVMKTDLALTLPYRSACQYDLVIRELPFEVPPLDLHLYWHRNRESDPAHQWLRHFVRQLAQDGGAQDGGAQDGGAQGGRPSVPR